MPSIRIHGCGAIQCDHTKKTDTLTPSCHQVSVTPYLGVRPYETSDIHAGICDKLDLVQTLWRESEMLWVHACNNNVIFNRQHFITLPPTPNHILFLCPFSQSSPHLRAGERTWYKHPTHGWVFTFIYFQQFEQLCVSAWSIRNWQKKALCGMLRAAQIYVYKRKCLESILTQGYLEK